MDLDTLDARLRKVEDTLDEMRGGRGRESMDPELRRQIHAPLHNADGSPVTPPEDRRRPAQPPMTSRSPMPGEGDVFAQAAQHRELSREDLDADKKRRDDQLRGPETDDQKRKREQDEQAKKGGGSSTEVKRAAGESDADYRARILSAFSFHDSDKGAINAASGSALDEIGGRYGVHRT